MAHAQAVGFDGMPDEGMRDDASWRRAHAELVRLAKKRAGLDFEEGRWLLRAFRAGAHVKVGLGSFNEYVERLFGYGPRFTQEKLRVAEALEGLPETALELEAGKVSFSAVRELTRVAIPSTEREWLEATRHRTVREVERLVSGHRPGDLPSDTPKPGAKRHVLRFEVSGETLATFREAMGKIRRDAGQSLDDDAALLLFSRRVLEGPRDEGRCSYQVALTVCEECRRGTQQGRGERVEVSTTAVEMAECDAQDIGHVDAAASNFHTSVSGVQAAAPGIHVAAPSAHVGTNREPKRARQSIPPARRRTVLRRDGGCCQVPGCRNAIFVDVHHLRPRSEGGSEDIENLVTLCGAHHHAIHDGRLLCEGTPCTGLTFRHADGTPYGAQSFRPLSAAGGEPRGLALAPMSSDARVKAFRALTHMGFRESEARDAIGRVPHTAEVTVDSLLREALRALVPMAQ